jgi:TonB-linked SusC/RagA family outer membrane protein
MKNQLLITLTGLLCFFATLNGQQKITGKVTSAIEEESLIGVTVMVKGTSQATVTDIEGKFAITASPSDTLLFSYIGYERLSLAVGNQLVINIVLSPEIQALSDVVVIGYGTVRKIDLTGSVSNVKTGDLSISATTSIDNLLQGRAAGLNLTSRSAQPGGGLNINIRGELSPNGSNAPLYVIDGVPLTDNSSVEPSLNDATLGYYGGVDRSPLNTINPSDIESIDILKDASAAAIYGSAAANGVILITTKKGKEGKLTVDYRGSFTMQSPKPYYDLLNATEFRWQHNRMMYETYLYNQGAGPYGEVDPATLTYDYPFTQQEIDEAGEGTDWLDVVMRDGSIQEHNISLTGGSEKSQIYTSFNYYNNKAILENSDFIRYTGRVNIDQKLSNRVNTSLRLNFSQISSNNAATGSNSGGVEKYNMLQAAYSFAPDREIYDEYGNYTYSYDRQVTNPAAFLIIDDQMRSTRFSVAPKITIDIVKGLSLVGTGGMDRQGAQRGYYLPVAAQRSNVPNGMAQLGTNRIDNYSAEGYLNYTKKFANSNLTFVGGAGYYKTISDGFGLVSRGYFTDAFGYNNVGISSDKMQNTINSYRSEKTKISQFFRMNYSLSDKYLLSVVGRRDAASDFAPEKKYGFFPGVSAAWRISEESFMGNASFVSDLKLRAGYGTSGNENLNGANWMRLYRTNGAGYSIGSNVYPEVILSQEENRNLSWETDVTIDIGLDFGFLSNRITGTFDYFNRTASDLLLWSQQPYNNAIRNVYQNAGATRSVGYEVMIKSNNIATGQFSWTTEFTLSTFKAFWAERDLEVELPEYVGENDELHAIYGWETDGIIKTDADRPSYMPNAYLGNIKYKDQNDDGVLDVKDVKQIGNTDPKWSVGLGNTFTFKGFDFNFYFYGFLKRAGLYGYRPGGVSSSTGSTQYSIAIDPPGNVLTTIEDVWTSDNTDGIYPGVAPDLYSGQNPAVNTHLPSGNQFYGVNTDFYLRDASFLRLKNITLGYTLPYKNILNTIHSARFYIDLQNVAVITKYEGFDPEYSDVNPYPQAFSTTLGVNITF